MHAARSARARFALSIRLNIHRVTQESERAFVIEFRIDARYGNEKGMRVKIGMAERGENHSRSIPLYTCNPLYRSICACNVVTNAKENIGRTKTKRHIYALNESVRRTPLETRFPLNSFLFVAARLCTSYSAKRQ